MCHLRASKPLRPGGVILLPEGVEAQLIDRQADLHRIELDGAISFAELLDGVRRDAALQAVGQTTRPLADIGQALGFAEPAVFWRAFRRWSGSTPAAWRAAQRADRQP